MGDIVETMLRDVMTALMNNDRRLVGEVSRLDNVVDRLDEAIKLYITKLTRNSLDEREGRRAMEIVSFTINLEYIGDIIDKNLCELAAKKIKRRYQFSSEGAAELIGFPQEGLRKPSGRVRHFHDRRRRGARRSSFAKKPKCVRPSSKRPTGISTVARRPAGEFETTSLHLDILRRPQAHPLAHLLGRLSGVGSRGEMPGRESERIDVPATDTLTYQPKFAVIIP